MTVHEFTLLGTTEGEADGVPVLDCDVRVRCSSGTYIRALARDLGALLGSAGHLTALRRTRVGPFGLDRSHTIAADTSEMPVLDLADVARSCFPVLEVDDAGAREVGYGRPLSGIDLSGITAVLHGDRFLALYRPGERGTAAVAEAVFV